MKSLLDPSAPVQAATILLVLASACGRAVAQDLIIDGTAETFNDGLTHNFEEIRVGNTLPNSSLTIEHQSELVNSSFARIGFAEESEGTVNLSGSGSKWTAGIGVDVGSSGVGALMINQGAEGSAAGALRLGFLSGSTGTMTVTGVDSKWSNGGVLGVGVLGTGTMTVSGGGEVSSGGEGGIGSGAGSIGTVTVTGGGSRWTTGSGELFLIGRAGTGTLTVEDGGRVQSEFSRIAAETGSTGTVTIKGTGSLWESTSLDVGRSGIGTLMIEDGGRVSSSTTADLGLFPGAEGTVRVIGADSIWEHDGAVLHLGRSGSGTLTVEDGGDVSSRSAFIGTNSVGSGAATVSGPNSSWTNSLNMTVGNGGTGTLTIDGGGQVLNASTRIGAVSGSEGLVTVMGADSLLANSNGLFVGGGSSGSGGNGTLTVANGGRVTDGGSTTVWQSGAVHVGSGGTIAIDGSLTNSGVVEIDAGGAVSAGSTSNTGRMTNHGTLTGDVTTLDGGLLTGTGMFAGSVTVADGGLFSPGASPGTVSTDPTVWASGGSYLWEINALAGFGGSEGSDPGWDLWHTGDLSIEGPFTIALTSLTLDNDPGLLAGWDPLLDYQWRIATADNAAFLSLDDLLVDTSGFQNPFAGGLFSLSASDSGNDLFLNFEASAVPEPSSLALLGTGMLALAGLGRRRGRRKPGGI